MQFKHMRKINIFVLNVNTIVRFCFILGLVLANNISMNGRMSHNTLHFDFKRNHTPVRRSSYKDYITRSCGIHKKNIELEILRRPRRVTTVIPSELIIIC